MGRILAADYADYADLIPGFHQPFPSEAGSSEVHDQRNFHAGRLHVGKRLRNVRFYDRTSGFKLDDHAVLD